MPDRYWCDLCDPASALQRRISPVRAQQIQRERLEMAAEGTSSAIDSEASAPPLPPGLSAAVSEPALSVPVTAAEQIFLPEPPHQSLEQAERSDAPLRPSSAPLAISQHPLASAADAPGPSDTVASCPTLTASQLPQAPPSTSNAMSATPKAAVASKPRARRPPKPSATGPGRPKQNNSSQPQPTPGPSASQAAVGPAPELAAAISEQARLSLQPTRASLLAPRPGTLPSQSAATAAGLDFGATSPLPEDPDAWRYELIPLQRPSFADASAREQALRAVEHCRRVRGLRLKRRNGTVRSLTLRDALESPPVIDFAEDPVPAGMTVKAVFDSAMFLKPPSESAYLDSASSALHVPRPLARPPAYGVFAASIVGAGDLIGEVSGHVCKRDAYIANPLNQYDRMRLVKPGAHHIAGVWDLVVDSRVTGNAARFARPGCHPNAVVCPIVVPQSARIQPQTAAPSINGDSGINSGDESDGGEGDDSDGPARADLIIDDVGDKRLSTRLSFGLFALTDIAEDEEIVVPWHWDDGHLIRSLPSLLALEGESDQLKQASDEQWRALSRAMSELASLIVSVGHCACEAARDCAIYWLCRGGAPTIMPPDEGAPERPPFATLLLNSLQTTKAEGAPPAKRLRRQRKPNLGPLMQITRSGGTDETLDSPEPDALDDEDDDMSGPAGTQRGQASDDDDFDGSDSEESILTEPLPASPRQRERTREPPVSSAPHIREAAHESETGNEQRQQSHQEILDGPVPIAVDEGPPTQERDDEGMELQRLASAPPLTEPCRRRHERRSEGRLGAGKARSTPETFAGGLSPAAHAATCVVS